jgi:hypothetical protein
MKVCGGRILLGVLGIALLGAPAPVRGQFPTMSGYYLHAAAGVESTPFSASGLLDVQRLRLMSRPALGSLTLDVAYEHTLTLRTTDLALGRGLEGMDATAPWLSLQGTLRETERVEWAHGLDRLSVAWHAGDRVRLTLGRQSISWANGLYFTPTDPFVPFDPADPFREFRGGVDALRGVVFLGPFTEVDAVLRPARVPGGGTALTALVRGQTTVRGWDVSAWGGVVHEEAGAALALTGSVGDTGLRAEAGLRRHEGETVPRVAVGADRLFQLLDRDLRAIVEVQHDGFGAGGAEDLLVTAGSLPYARGELQLLGRDAVVAHAAWQLHPLTAVSLLSLVNARDGSLLLAPAVERSMSDEISLRMGAFVGVGPGAEAGRLRSEHGATPLAGYVAASVFF